MKITDTKTWDRAIAQIAMEHSGLGDPTCLEMDMKRLLASQLQEVADKERKRTIQEIYNFGKDGELYNPRKTMAYLEKLEKSYLKGEMK